MSSSIPAAMAALAAIYPRAYIGEPTQAQAGDFVAVGWSGPDAPAVAMTMAVIGPAVQQEQYTVAVQLVAWQGDANLAACVERACAMFDVLLDALTADKTLGRAVVSARVASAELRPDQTERGAIATFSVSIDVIAIRR